MMHGVNKIDVGGTGGASAASGVASAGMAALAARQRAGGMPMQPMTPQGITGGAGLMGTGGQGGSGGLIGTNMAPQQQGQSGGMQKTRKEISQVMELQKQQALMEKNLADTRANKERDLRKAQSDVLYARQQGQTELLKQAYAAREKAKSELAAADVSLGKLSVVSRIQNQFLSTSVDAQTNKTGLIGSLDAGVRSFYGNKASVYKKAVDKMTKAVSITFADQSVMDPSAVRERLAKQGKGPHGASAESLARAGMSLEGIGLDRDPSKTYGTVYVGPDGRATVVQKGQPDEAKFVTGLADSAASIFLDGAKEGTNSAEVIGATSQLFESLWDASNPIQDGKNGLQKREMMAQVGRAIGRLKKQGVSDIQIDAVLDSISEAGEAGSVGARSAGDEAAIKAAGEGTPVSALKGAQDPVVGRMSSRLASFSDTVDLMGGALGGNVPKEWQLKRSSDKWALAKDGTTKVNVGDLVLDVVASVAADGKLDDTEVESLFSGFSPELQNRLQGIVESRLKAMYAAGGQEGAGKEDFAFGKDLAAKKEGLRKKEEGISKGQADAAMEAILGSKQLDDYARQKASELGDTSALEMQGVDAQVLSQLLDLSNEQKKKAINIGGVKGPGA